MAGMALAQSHLDSYETPNQQCWQRSYDEGVDWDWRPAEDRPEGLFAEEHEEDWVDLQEWISQVSLMMWRRRRGLSWERLPDFFRPSSHLRPEARAAAPWLTGRTLHPHIVPAATYFSGPYQPQVNVDFWGSRSATDMDKGICDEMREGFSNGGSVAHIHLCMHHDSFMRDHWEAGVGILDGDVRDGYLQNHGTVPYLPCQSPPKGVVDQVTKQRGISNLSHPKGKVVEGAQVAINGRVDLESQPPMNLSSGRAYGRNVGVMTTASQSAKTLQVKRDAKGAYRQMHIIGRDFCMSLAATEHGVLVDVRVCFGGRLYPLSFQRAELVVVRVAAARMAAFDRLHPPAELYAREWLADRVLRLGADQATLFALLQYLDDSLLTSLNDLLVELGVRRGECHAYILDATMEEAGIAMAGGAKRVESEGAVEGLGIEACPLTWEAYYPADKAARLKLFIQAILDEGATLAAVSRPAVQALIGKEKWVAGVAPQVNPLLASGYRLINAACPLEHVPVSDAFIRDQQKILEIIDSDPRVPLVPKATFPSIALPSGSLARRM